MEIDNDDSVLDAENILPSTISNQPPSLVNTHRLRSSFVGNAAKKVEAVLYFMDTLDLNLTLFLDFLSWENHKCSINTKIWYEHTALMISDELPGILEHWYRPLCSHNSHHARAHGGSHMLELFTFKCVGDVLNTELDGLRDLCACPSDKVSEIGLTSFFVEDMLLKLSSPGFGGALKLWNMLQTISSTTEQRL
ncbi:hypothetical protein F5I97DRAFT_1933788 [Phlebopus sp. FC_14]|nr:hypothetical protein F5I97DRAFT_1933788 [Phlebopus sp. FC_14]